MKGTGDIGGAAVPETPPERVLKREVHRTKGYFDVAETTEDLQRLRRVIMDARALPKRQCCREAVTEEMERALMSARAVEDVCCSCAQAWCYDEDRRIWRTR